MEDARVLVLDVGSVALETSPNGIAAEFKFALAGVAASATLCKSAVDGEGRLGLAFGGVWRENLILVHCIVAWMKLAVKKSGPLLEIDEIWARAEEDREEAEHDSKLT